VKEVIIPISEIGVAGAKLASATGAESSAFLED